jgi:hypothetical protein
MAKSKTSTKHSGSETKCKKSRDSSSSSSECCVSDHDLDCCTSQYQRLNRLLTLQSVPNSFTFNYNDGFGNGNGSFYRSGVAVPLGSTAALGDAYFNPGATGSQSTTTVTYSGNTAGSSGANGTQNAYNPYNWVNSERYLSFEPSCKNDQVWGWYVDTASGQLQLFQETDGVPTWAVRYDLLSAQYETMTPQQRKQLKLLNKLYKLSLKAVKEVRAMPKTEGNIVQVTDKCGQKWLIAINFAQTYNINVLANEQQYVVVACKL